MEQEFRREQSLPYLATEMDLSMERSAAAAFPRRKDLLSPGDEEGEGRRSCALWTPSTAAELEMHQNLGEGAFGKVYRATARSNQKREFAVKKVPIVVLEKTGMREQMENECGILASCRHPHIVQLHFHFEDAGMIYLGMEYLAGQVFSQMQAAAEQGAGLSNETSAQYFWQVCDALQYLHTALPRTVVHRDIKPENVLLDQKGGVKLVDFGWAVALQDKTEKRKTLCGTPDYAAPEMVSGEGYNESVDMWQAGVLLFEFLTGNSPFAGDTQAETFRKIMRVSAMGYPRELDPMAKQLLRGLLRRSPKERLTAEKAKAHPFVQRFGCSGAAGDRSSGSSGAQKQNQHRSRL